MMHHSAVRGREFAREMQFVRNQNLRERSDGGGETGNGIGEGGLEKELC